MHFWRTPSPPPGGDNRPWWPVVNFLCWMLGHSRERAHRLNPTEYDRCRRCNEHLGDTS